MIIQKWLAKCSKAREASSCVVYKTGRRRSPHMLLKSCRLLETHWSFIHVGRLKQLESAFTRGWLQTEQTSRVGKLTHQQGGHTHSPAGWTRSLTSRVGTLIHQQAGTLTHQQGRHTLQQNGHTLHQGRNTQWQEWTFVGLLFAWASFSLDHPSDDIVHFERGASSFSYEESLTDPPRNIPAVVCRS